LSAPVAGMLTTARPSVQVDVNTTCVLTLITTASALMLTVSVGVRLCWNKQLRTDLVDEAVWEEVCRLLEQPERLEQEDRRCLVQEEKLPDELSSLETRMGRLR
jgi:hypothetical protein